MSKNKKQKSKAAKKSGVKKSTKPNKIKAKKPSSPKKMLALKKPSKAIKLKEKKDIKPQLKAPVAQPLKALKGKAALEAAKASAQASQNQEPKEDVILTNADGKRYCKVHDCDEAAVIDGHCRLHYIMFWKRNKNKTKILEGSKLDKYIEELTQRYPDKYLEMLKKDLSNEKDFTGIINEMDADDAADEAESEDDNRFIEEVRGGVPTSSDDDEGF